METSFDWMLDVKPMTPEMLWLKDNFGNLTEVIKDDKVYYVDSERKPLFMYYQDEENGYVYINYSRIGSKLKKDFGLNYSETQDVITEWLGEVYNLTGFTPWLVSGELTSKSWEIPII